MVHVKIENLNPQCSRWDGTHRIIDIDLNTLDVIFNLKSWVMIFDFFGIGKMHALKKYDQFGLNTYYIKAVFGGSA